MGRFAQNYKKIIVLSFATPLIFIFYTAKIHTFIETSSDKSKKSALFMGTLQFEIQRLNIF